MRVPCASLRGNLRCSLQAGSAQTRFAQTRAALIRLKLRSSARTEGKWVGPSLRSAANSLAALGRSSVLMQRLSLRSARVDPVLTPTPTPQKDAPWRVEVKSPLAAPRSAAFRGSGPRVFERSEFARTPRKASTAGCPVAKRRGHAQWGRLLLLPFLGETRKGSRPPGRIPGLSLKPTARAKQANDALTPALCQREREQDLTLSQREGVKP